MRRILPFSPVLLTFTFLSTPLACAPKALPQPAAAANPPASAEAPAPARVPGQIQICIPQMDPPPSATYLVIKQASKPDHVFERVHFECTWDEEASIRFHALIGVIRSPAEQCGAFDVEDASAVPEIIFFPGREDGTLSAYTRVPLRQVIKRIFLAAPCGTNPRARPLLPDILCRVFCIQKHPVFTRCSFSPATGYSPRTGLGPSTIAAGELNCCVRNGNRCNIAASITGPIV